MSLPCPRWMYAKHLLGDTTGPRPIVSPGSVHPALGVEFGVGAERRDSPEFILGGSVSMRLGLGLDVAPGEAVDLTPAFGSGYWNPDGVAYLTGPALDMTTGVHVVLWYRRPIAYTRTLWSLWYSSSNHGVGLSGDTLWHATQYKRSGSFSDAVCAADVSERQCAVFALPIVSGKVKPHCSTNGGTEVAAESGLTTPFYAAPVLQIGRTDVVSYGGWDVYAIAIYTGADRLADAERIAIHASGAIVDPTGAIARQPTYLYSMADAYDSGAGVMKVPDRITSDAGKALTQVAGTADRFALGAWE